MRFSARLRRGGPSMPSHKPAAAWISRAGFGKGCRFDITPIWPFQSDVDIENVINRLDKAKVKDSDLTLLGQAGNYIGQKFRTRLHLFFSCLGLNLGVKPTAAGRLTIG